MKTRYVLAIVAVVALAVVGYSHKTVADEMRAERITIGVKTVELR